jgi:putative transposase
MPRVKRGLSDGLIYHVLNRGNGKKEIFHKEKDFWVFIELIKEAKKDKSKAWLRTYS